MKKSLKYLSFLAISFIALTITVNARVITDDELENAYVIGTHLFTEDGTKLDTETIMFAARTIEGIDATDEVSIEDMIIYFKPAGEDRWINALTNEEIAEPTGIRENNYFTHINLVEQVDSIGLSEASNISTDGLTTDAYAEDIKYNQSAISVEAAGNIITVTENKYMRSWDNTIADAKWYAILIDLGVSKDRISTTADSNYIIEEIDKTDAERFGATNDNQFILWLRGGTQDLTREITFVDTETNEEITVRIDFKATTANASTRADLEEYLANPNIDTIYLANDITGLDSRIIINRAVTINGNGNTLGFTDAINSAPYGERQGIVANVSDVVINDLAVEMNAVDGNGTWTGTYAIQVYMGSAILNNITATGADGGIFSNDSTVTLTGNIDVSGNEFGGIEVSNGSSTLNATEATFTNTTEAFGLPTIWTDSAGVTVNVGNKLTSTTVYKKDGESTKAQQQYYLNADLIEDALMTSNIGTITAGEVSDSAPASINPNGSASIIVHDDYDAIRFEIANITTPENAKVKVWAMDTNNNVWDMIESGWGPAAGFSVQAGYSATTPFQIVADTAGDYSATINLVDVNSNTVIASTTISFTIQGQV